MKIEMNIESCLDCPKSKSGYDPDPYDSFNSDDMYCSCTLLPNDKINKQSIYFSERQPYKVITCGDRPYQLRKYSCVPEWCPLIPQNKDLKVD